MPREGLEETYCESKRYVYAAFIDYSIMLAGSRKGISSAFLFKR
jgi:hypothetical protein